MLKVFDLAELTKHRSPLRRPFIWGLAAVSFLLFLLLIAYLFKGAIANSFLSQYCASRDLSCSAKLSSLTLSRVEAHSVEIGLDGQAPSVVADAISADLTWRGFQPSVSDVGIDAIDIFIGFDGSEFDLRGLDRLGGGGGGTAPTLDISNGSLTVATPAGPIEGTFSASGELQDEFVAQLSLVPARLSTAAGELDLRRGRANLTSTAGSIAGDLELDISRFEVAETQLDDLRFRIDRAEQTEIIDWSLSARRMARQARSLEDIDMSGVIALTQTSGNALFDRVDRIEGAGISGQLESNDHIAAETAFTFSALKSAADDPALTVEVALLDLEGPTASADDATIIYSGEIDVRRQRLSGGGELIANGAGLGDQLSHRLFSRSVQAGPFSAHLAQMNRALAEAGSGFATRIPFEADADLSGQWQILITSRLGLVSDTGFVASLSPGLAGPVLSANSNDITFSGLAALSGGGAPSLTADIQQIRISDAGSLLNVGGLQLDPWTVNRTTISSQLNRSTFAWGDEGLSMRLIGQVALAGDVFGWQIRNGRLFGSLDARSDTQGLRVQMLDSDCLGIAFDTATGADTLTVGPVSTAICPEDGRLLETSPGSSQGRLKMGAIEVPLSGANLTGHARLARTDLNWRAGDTLFMKLDAPSAELELEIAGRSFNMEAAEPSTVT